jgi:modulator of FtsH protease
VITDWNPFFTAQTGAFAALTGLVFVALSINLKQILSSPGLPGRAGEAVIVLVEPVLLGMLGLLPRQSVRTLGSELLVIAIVGWVAVTTIVVSGRYALRQRPFFERASRIIVVQTATLLVVAAAALLMTGHRSGLDWEVAGTGFCLVAGMTDAWVLLIEILR